MRNIEKLQNYIHEFAPHGSGIDYDYTNIRYNSYKMISMECAYHLMDENGFYDSVIPFRVTIDRDLKVKVQFLGLNNHGWYKVRVKYPFLREDLINEYQYFVNDNADDIKQLL